TTRQPLRAFRASPGRTGRCSRLVWFSAGIRTRTSGRYSARMSSGCGRTTSRRNRREDGVTSSSVFNRVIPPVGQADLHVEIDERKRVALWEGAGNDPREPFASAWVGIDD